MNERSTEQTPSSHERGREADHGPGRRAAAPVRTKNLLGIGVGVLVMGLLIWAKLQLVAGVPRTAIATPEAETAPADSKGEGQKATAREPGKR